MPSSLSSNRRNGRHTHEPRKWGQISAWLVVVIAAAVWAINWWMEPPAAGFENLRYIQLTRTAVSSRSPEQVARLSAALERRLQNGKLTEAEHTHFRKILQYAESQEWEAAEQMAWDFEVAQLGRSRPQGN